MWLNTGVRGDMSLQTIISGGQTGADRGALDAALEMSFPCGGWCPEGRGAEDGTLPPRYPLQELVGAGYRQRTIKNIQSSDGTTIFYFNQPTGGTELTLAQCIKLRKPYQLVDASEISPVRAGEVIYQFVQRNGVAVLNVAGPREGRTPGTYAYVREAVLSLIKACRAAT